MIELNTYSIHISTDTFFKSKVKSLLQSNIVILWLLLASLTPGAIVPFILDLAENSLVNCLKHRTKTLPAEQIQREKA